MLLDRSPNHGLYTGSDPDLRHLLLPMALAQQARKLRTEPKGAVCPCTCLKNTRRPCPPAPRRASGQGKQTGPCSVPASARDLPEHQQRTEPSSARYQPACIRLLPRDAWSPKTPLAGRDRFHHPAPTIPPKRTSSVRFSGRPPLPRGTINCIPRAANARSSAFLPVLVPHHPLRNLLRQHEIEPPLRQSRLMRPGRTALHRNGQSPGVHGNQDLHPACLSSRLRSHRLHHLPDRTPHPESIRTADTLRAPPPVAPPPATAVRIHPPAPSAGRLGGQHSWSRIAGAGVSFWRRYPAARKCRPEPGVGRSAAGRLWDSPLGSESLRRTNPTVRRSVAARPQVTLVSPYKTQAFGIGSRPSGWTWASETGAALALSLSARSSTFQTVWAVQSRTTQMRLSNPDRRCWACHRLVFVPSWEHSVGGQQRLFHHVVVRVSHLVQPDCKRGVGLYAQLVGVAKAAAE